MDQYAIYVMAAYIVAFAGMGGYLLLVGVRFLRARRALDVMKHDAEQP